MNEYKDNKRITALKEKYETQQKEMNEIKSLINEVDELLLYSGIEIEGSVKNINELVKQVGHQKEKKKPTKTNAVIVSVDCEKNTPEDIQNGGPQCLGYDFVVDSRNIEETIHYITSRIKKNKQPLIRVYTNYNSQLQDIHIWNIQRINECIEKGYK